VIAIPKAFRLTFFGGKRKVLSLEKIYNDIVVNKRGGFCYENNGLFCWLLREIGFNVEIMQGQVFVSAKKEYLPEFDHMCLMVIKKSMCGVASSKSVLHFVLLGYFRDLAC